MLIESNKIVGGPSSLNKKLKRKFLYRYLCETRVRKA